MAHKKGGGGALKSGRDSNPKYLGVKLFDGQKVEPGYVIVRQRGTKILPGKNVAKGQDDTLYALKSGKIRFKTLRKKTFSGSSKWVKVVNVE